MMRSSAWCARCGTATGNDQPGMEDGDAMITLENNRLAIRCPDVHPDARCTIDFQRTLRIPDDGTDYPLPPGLGRFPLRHLDDYAHRLPEAWHRRGGVITPMHQAEAMWISFGGSDYPFAVKIATGKICAVTGDDWVNHLNGDPQDYLVLPEQPWLDGYCVERGFIRQFVAMPLGEGYTAEEQLTGEAEHGGLQVVAYPMKRKRYERLMSPRFAMDFDAGPDVCSSPAPDMGLAPGGRMRQEIYDDPYGLDAWDQRHASRCFVSIANSTQWMAVTGERPPTLPPSAKEYSEAGLPWFEWYGGDAKAVAGAKKLASLASVAELGKVKGEDPLPENESTRVTGVRTIRRTGDTRVREFAAQ